MFIVIIFFYFLDFMRLKDDFISDVGRIIYDVGEGGYMIFFKII